MSNQKYFGTYARFETASKKDAAQLLGADNLVGDVFEIEFVTENGQRLAWMKNRFGAMIGFFDEETSRELSLCEARGWKLQALLSYIAYSEQPAPGLYWGEAAVICYDPDFAAFSTFVSKLGARLSEGNRPEVEMGEQGIKHVIESEGEWMPSKLLPKPKLEPGNALIKTRRSASEKLIEQGRKGNKGCYAISWIFLLALVAALLFALKSCGVF